MTHKEKLHHLNILYEKKSKASKDELLLIEKEIRNFCNLHEIIVSNNPL